MNDKELWELSEQITEDENSFGGEDGEICTKYGIYKGLQWAIKNLSDISWTYINPEVETYLTRVKYDIRVQVLYSQDNGWFEGKIRVDRNGKGVYFDCIVEPEKNFGQKADPGKDDLVIRLKERLYERFIIGSPYRGPEMMMTIEGRDDLISEGNWRSFSSRKDIKTIRDKIGDKIKEMDARIDEIRKGIKVEFLKDRHEAMADLYEKIELLNEMLTPVEDKTDS